MRENFKTDLEHLINSYSLENNSDTPDFLLAEYLMDCLVAFDKVVVERENWYGRTKGMENNLPPRNNACEVKETQIQRQLISCGQNLDSLETCLNDFLWRHREKRIDAILVPNPPSTCSEEKIASQKDVMVALAGNIKSFADRIKYATTRLIEIKNRVEL